MEKQRLQRELIIKKKEEARKKQAAARKAEAEQKLAQEGQKHYLICVTSVEANSLNYLGKLMFSHARYPSYPCVQN